MAWKCVLCGFACLIFSLLLSHYNSTHGSEKSFTVTCNINGCEKRYNNVQSFVRHAKERHAVFLSCRGPYETDGQPEFEAIEGILGKSFAFFL